MTEPNLSRLASSRKWQDQCTAARHPDLPEDLLRSLAKAWSFMVRAAIAERTDLPADVRAALFDDEELRVSLALARRPDLTTEEAERLFATRADASVMEALVASGKLPEVKNRAAMNMLNGWAFVRLYTEGKVSEAEAVSRAADPQVALTISRTVKDTGEVTEAMFERLLRSTNPYVIENLAVAALSGERLARVEQVANSKVRILLAGNIRITPETAEQIMLGRSRHAIEKLLSHEQWAQWAVTHNNAEVRLATVKHLAFTHPVRQGMLSDPDPRVRKALVSAAQPTEVLDVLARDEDPAVRGEVARVTPTAAHLALLAQDPVAAVRVRVAARALAGVEVLAMLADDPAKRVRETAGLTFLNALGG